MQCCCKHWSLHTLVHRDGKFVGLTTQKLQVPRECVQRSIPRPVIQQLYTGAWELTFCTTSHCCHCSFLKVGKLHCEGLSSKYFRFCGACMVSILYSCLCLYNPLKNVRNILSSRRKIVTGLKPNTVAHNCNPCYLEQRWKNPEFKASLEKGLPQKSHQNKTETWRRQLLF